MIKRLLFVLFAFLSVNALAAETPLTITLTVDNTSGLSDEQAAADLAAVILADPDYQGTVVELTVGTASQTVDKTLRRDTIGMKETLKPSQWAVDAGTVIKGATGGMSGSASAKVEVTHKGKDGSETTVKVEIKIEGKK